MLQNSSSFHRLADAHGRNILGTIPVYPLPIKNNTAAGHLSLFRLEHSRDGSQCRGLARAIRPEQGSDLSVPDLEGYASQHLNHFHIGNFNTVYLEHLTFKPMSNVKAQDPNEIQSS